MLICAVYRYITNKYNINQRVIVFRLFRQRDGFNEHKYFLKELLCIAAHSIRN